MIIKIIGCIVIMLCSVKIGFDEAGKFRTRINEIREIQTAFAALKGEIGFRRAPIAEALANAGIMLKTSVAKLFLTAKDELKSDNITAAEAWERSFEKTKEQLCLTAEELYIVSSFGKLLGVSDTSGQLENIELATARLELCEKQAIEDERRRGRLYRSLGVIGGIVLAVIFI